MAFGRSWHSPDLTKQYLCAVTLVFALNALSAILFMVSVRRPVYDDEYLMFDVHAYAAHGISLAAIRAQRNAPGPTSFIWMATAVRFIGHDELLDARIAILLSWFLLTLGMIVGARYSAWPQLWYGALLATLIFPHSALASATTLTEGPALLFALVGVLAWTESASRQTRISTASLTVLVIAGLSIGLAITCRQYFLALLPAAGALTVFLWKDRCYERRFQRLGMVIVSLIAAVIPVLLLFLIWKGLTSPGIATGMEYSNYHAEVGIAWFRPVVVTLFAAIYFVPYSFPAMWEVSLKRRWPALLSALLVGLVAAYFRDSFLDLGLLHTLVGVASRIPAGGALLFWLMTSVATYNAIAVCLLLWGERSRLRTCVPVVFALFVVFLFIAEQLGVGGNIPFYDRYVLQLAPFLGLIGFWLFPRFTWSRILAIAGLYAVSQATLWQHAIIGRVAH
jgi:hypothetical protein